MRTIFHRKTTTRARRRFGFRAKVLLSIGGITLTACALVSFFFFRLSAQTVEENYVLSQSRMLRVTMQSLEETLSSAYDTSIALSCDQTLYEMMSAYAVGRGGSEQAQEISAYLRQYQTDSSMIDSIYLYLPHREQAITSADYHAVQEIFFTQNYTWMEYQQENPAGTRLAPVILYDDVNRAPQYVLAYTRPIYDETQNILAWLAVNLSERDLFYHLLSTGTQEAEDEYYLVDAEGTILLTKDTAAIGRPFTEVRPGGTLPESSLASVRYGASRLLTALRSPMTGFQLVSLN